jgi:hypothetical protein
MEAVLGGPDPAVLAIFGLDRHQVTVLSDVPAPVGERPRAARWTPPARRACR